MKTTYASMSLALEKCTVADRVPVIAGHVSIRQFAGHMSGGCPGGVTTVLSSTVLPSSHVSAGGSRTPLPHVCGFVVVVVLVGGTVVVVVVLEMVVDEVVAP